MTRRPRTRHPSLSPDQKSRAAALAMQVYGQGADATIATWTEIGAIVMGAAYSEHMRALRYHVSLMNEHLSLSGLPDGETLTPDMAGQIKRIRSLGGMSLPQQILCRLCQCRLQRLVDVLDAAGLVPDVAPQVGRSAPAQARAPVEQAAPIEDGLDDGPSLTQKTVGVGLAAFLRRCDLSAGRFEDQPRALTDNTKGRMPRPDPPFIGVGESGYIMPGRSSLTSRRAA